MVEGVKIGGVVIKKGVMVEKIKRCNGRRCNGRRCYDRNCCYKKGCNDRRCKARRRHGSSK